MSTYQNIHINSNIIENTRAFVVGAGASGQAAVRLLHSLGAKVNLVEKNIEKIPQEFKSFLQNANISLISGEHKKEDFASAQLVVISPGVPLNNLHPLLPELCSIIAETELAWQYLEEEPILAITGTSGKTTTTSICDAMLLAQGKKVFTGGNIGTPLSEYVLARKAGAPKVDIIVLELSSFQLQTCFSFRPHIALMLNISPNHLDHHKDMQEYLEAKLNIFQNQTANDFAIFSKTLEESLPENLKTSLTKRLTKPLPKPLGESITDNAFRAKVQYFDPNAQTFPETSLPGQHNQANAEAAWQACQLLGVEFSTAKKVLKDFNTLENRLEIVDSINNILFVNDSKCTTTEALRVALGAFDRPIHLLAGGKFKGGDLKGLIPLLKEKVKSVALYGASKEIFLDAWEEELKKNNCTIVWNETMRDAVNRLYSMASQGDVVLLAPATASFDQYKDYIHRGADFRNIVLELKQTTTESRS